MDAQEEKKLYKKLVKTCNKLGWDIAIGSDSEETVTGLIIGTDEWVKEITEKLESCQKKENKSKKKRK